MTGGLVLALRAFVRRTPVHSWWASIGEEHVVREWREAGKPAPAPPAVKRRIVREVARRYHLRILVETGTYLGDTVAAVKGAFDEIYSIELGLDLFQHARKRFAEDRHVVLLQGDSGDKLAEVLPKLRRPCLFWLDAHYSRGATARGSLQTPIEKELALIAAHPLRRKHVILVDDARHFTGDGDYPKLAALQAWAAKAGLDHFAVEDDIIRITAARAPA